LSNKEKGQRDLVNEGFVGRDALAGEAALLPMKRATGCGKSFSAPMVNLAGRAHGGAGIDAERPELALQQLGQTPLGRYLFTSSTLTRDFIEIGRDAELWGRRSRLRLSGKPLLLTELFLPASPLY
jgi:chorismate--pyruvate lyase